jgi:hypothetical protein
VAEERNEDRQRILKPKIADVRFKEREKALFASGEAVPNWKLADKSRRILADINRHLSAGLPPRPPQTALKDLDISMVRQAAGISAAAITIRAVGSGMALVSCGYMPESAFALRRAQEARLHAQAVRDAAGSDYAVRFLERKATGIAKLAQRYGVNEDIATLSALAHADVQGLLLLGFETKTRGPGSVAIDTRPKRNECESGVALYLHAQAAVQMTRVLAEIFDVDVEMPQWVVGELKRFSREAEAERDEARGP